ncbi:putative MATE family efflux protein [Enterococcus sp. PF1-24]|uniref:MATE family efflux transporter n=1 Tax=unclassified Enterococcus TaxID=2608891 RepID=UPI002474BBF2|nr:MULTISPECIES: MATE family efflux transporter [unclassified Enterococcus]MDH6365144.1 putative MATE family efflux protein [Enterococcus sp. PFB1-1]MDH6402272.1 putative MATE family efflux protein [Enterococcus sp. PF1-24]
MTEIENPLGTEKISKLLIKFSIPAIIGMLVNALYNIVDRIYIGNAEGLGGNGLAGITIGFPIMIILLAVGLLFGVGGATLFSIRLGEKRPQEAEKALGNAFSLLVISGLVLMILGQLFLTPVLKMFGASEVVLPFAIEYMRIIFFGAVFQIVSSGLNNFMRADGQPQLAMVTMFMGAGVNIILDPIFIYVFNMGMSGAALATILSQFISMVWILIYFFGKKAHHRLQFKNMKIEKSIFFEITALGLPNFLMQLGNSLLNIVLNVNLHAYGGDIAVSGMGIVNSIQTILLMPITGLVQGTQPIVSFNFGAKKFSRVKEAQKLAITAATIIVIIGWIVTRLFPKVLVGLFNREPELLKFGTFALKTWFLLLPVIGFQIVASSYFQATGRTRSAIFLTLTRQMIFLIPAILIFSNIWGLEGLLHAAPFADGMAALLTGTFYFISLKQLTTKNEETSVVEV